VDGELIEHQFKNIQYSTKAFKNVCPVMQVIQSIQMERRCSKALISWVLLAFHARSPFFLSSLYSDPRDFSRGFTARDFMLGNVLFSGRPES